MGLSIKKLYNDKDNDYSNDNVCEDYIHNNNSNWNKIASFLWP